VLNVNIFAVIFYVQNMKMLNETLTTKAFVEILSADDPKVTDEYGSVNLELEVCLLLQNGCHIMAFPYDTVSLVVIDTLHNTLYYLEIYVKNCSVYNHSVRMTVCTDIKLRRSFSQHYKIPP